HLGIEHAKVDIGKGGEKRDIRRAQSDLHRVFIQRLDVRGARDQEAWVVVNILEPAVGKHHVGGGHRIAVEKADIVPEVEGIDLAAADRGQGRGQIGYGVNCIVAVIGDERVVAI